MDLMKEFEGLSLTAILIAVAFSIVGWIAFRRGRKESEPRPIFLGIALMAYGYFVSNAWVSFGVGALLTLLLFFPR
jgi:MFS family permease